MSSDLLAGTQAEAPPDTRGPTAPIPLAILVAGWVALLAVSVGTLLIQIAFALGPETVSDQCVAWGVDPSLRGALGVCNIVAGVRSSSQTAMLLLAVVVGFGVVLAGFGMYKRMPTKRQREEAISGAVLGIIAIGIAIFVQIFRSGETVIITNNFLNFDYLEGTLGLFVRGAKVTLILAFAGEIGGIIIGLVLSMMAISKRRVVRAPARVYINFFRGTPLLWQLSMGYFGVALGLQIQVSALVVAGVVFALNMGSYSAEVFRAGLQSIERGQIEAARSLGMSYGTAMRYAIVPQAIRRVIPPLMNEFVILIKDTSLITILGLLVSEYDLFSVGRGVYSSTFNATPYLAVAAGYLIVTLPMIRLVNAVEKRVRSGLVGIAGAS